MAAARVAPRLSPCEPGWKFSVWVQAGSRGDAIVGLRGDALKVAVAAPPEKGRANRALCKLLAQGMGVKPSAVSVVRGLTSRHKVVVVGAEREVVAGFLERFAAAGGENKRSEDR
jgi:hypothetical protein